MADQHFANGQSQSPKSLRLIHIPKEAEEQGPNQTFSLVSKMTLRVLLPQTPGPVYFVGHSCIYFRIGDITKFNFGLTTSTT